MTVPEKHRAAITVALVCLGVIAAVAAVFAVGNRVAVRSLPTKTEVKQEVAKQVEPEVKQQVAPKAERAQGTADQVARDLAAAKDELLAKQAAVDERLQELEARGPVIMPSPTPVPSPIVVTSPIPVPSPPPSPEPSPSPTEPMLPEIPPLPPLLPGPEPSPSPSACSVVHLDLIQQPALCL